jgi:periplasmic divalent cation tolerance protein
VDDFIIIYCTVPTKEIAVKIAEDLAHGMFAACVNIISNVESVYRWKGNICRDNELLLVIKTRKSRFTAIQDRILSLHPYEVPEIISVDITRGSDTYLQWIVNETNPAYREKI